MHVLERISTRILEAETLGFKRYLYDEIDFENRLIILTGCRGVGKSTLLRQYLKSKEKPLYLTLDHIYFSSHTLLDCLEEFYDLGYRTIGLDEVHKYPDWSIELKNAYDILPGLQLLVTSSSALKIIKGVGDLSRRASVYRLKGMSFREYLEYEHRLILPTIALEDLITTHVSIAEDLLSLYGSIPKWFKNYLKKGYYPFYKEAGKVYNEKLMAVVNQVLEVDLPAIFNLDYTAVRQMKRLYSLLSDLAPYSPNIKKMADQLGISRNRVLEFVDYLDSADLLNTLSLPQKSDSILTKPDKIFLENTNLIAAFSMEEGNLGTMRETFFRSAMGVKNKIYSPAKGDFMVDSRYVFEVGGKNKSTHQIHDMPNAHLVKDDIRIGYGSTIPLWVFGFVY
ncbi:MAG: ATP-binding protein [Leadbetterella sp.]